MRPLTDDEKAIIRGVWEADPTAPPGRVAKLASVRIGRAIDHRAAARNRPGSPERNRLLCEADREVIRSLWRADPAASNAEIARRATEAIGRKVWPNAVATYRPGPPPGPRLAAVAPAPEPMAPSTSPHESPLAHLIAEHRRVRRRLGIGITSNRNFA